MAVLFGPFRVRDTNPEGWDLKMNFWTNAVNKWCLQTRRVAFTLEDVRRAFARFDQQPHLDCLRLVLSTMKRRGSLLLDEDLPVTRNARSLGRNVLNWTVNSLLLKPLSLGWSFVAGGSGSLSSREEDGLVKSSTASSTSQQELERPLESITAETKLFNKETLDILVESVEAYLKTGNSIKSAASSVMRYEQFFNQLNK